MSQCRWIFRPPQSGAAELASALGLMPEVAAIMVQRGLADEAAARRFLTPRLAELRQPYLMAGMEAAVGRLELAVRRRERVTLFADYDVDGVTSAAILFELLQSVKVPVECVIPDRMGEGYGLGEAALKRVMATRPSLLVTLDSGISDAPRIAAAAAAGVETIVVDHHELPPEPPLALAIVNPKQPGCPFPFKALAAVGLAFYLACALRTRLLSSTGLPQPCLQPQDWLDLAALGTVADLVPLREENRILVKAGLERLSATTRPGLLALKEISGCRGQVTSGDIGYRLAPRLNAAGRMGDAGRALRLLLTHDAAEARELASALDDENTRRQAVEAQIEAECRHRLDGAALGHSVIMGSVGWHPGVIGIVASRLTERFHRPAIVLAEEGGYWRGSARGIRGLHLFEALSSCGHLLERFGGHRQAGGMLVSEGNLEGFREAFEGYCAANLTPADLTPLLDLDLPLPLERVSMRLAEELAWLEPYGLGNPRPVFAASAVRPLTWNRMRDQHLRATLGANGVRVEAVGFGLWGERPAGPVDIAFQAEVNEWRGARSLRLNLKAIRPAVLASAGAAPKIE